MALKTQIAGLAVAASLGAAGGALAVKEPSPQYRIHAMDLRTHALPDGGVDVQAEIWGDKLVDGKWKDLGKGSPALVDQKTVKQMFKDAEASVRE